MHNYDKSKKHDTIYYISIKEKQQKRKDKIML